jgi:hypothetical protein
MQDIDYSDFEPVGATGSAVPDGVEPDAPAPRVERLEPLSGSRVHRLLAPLKVDGEVLREIVLSPLTQKQVDDFVLGVIASRRALLCALTGQHAAVIEALIWPDSEALHQMLSDMLPDFLKD